MRTVDVAVGYCEECGDAVLLNDVHYNTKLGKVHEDCFEEFSVNYFQAEIVEGFEGLFS